MKLLVTLAEYSQNMGETRETPMLLFEIVSQTNLP